MLHCAKQSNHRASTGREHSVPLRVRLAGTCSNYVLKLSALRQAEHVRHTKPASIASQHVNKQLQEASQQTNTHANKQSKASRQGIKASHQSKPSRRQPRRQAKTSRNTVDQRQSNHHIENILGLYNSRPPGAYPHVPRGLQR